VHPATDDHATGKPFLTILSNKLASMLPVDSSHRRVLDQSYMDNISSE